MANIKLKPFYKPFKDIYIPGMFPYEHVEEVTKYRPSPDDVFIVTYPKCGTTWMQMVALNIFRKGVQLEDCGSFGRLSPFIDPGGLKSILNMPRPGALKTHLPFHLMPYSPDAKYVFVVRNPKDACVSLFYHAKSKTDYSEGVFDDFFELFMEGQVEYGDYFDHLQSWWPHRGDRNLFHTTYEDMKEDLRGVVIRLASFLGQEYAEAIEKDNAVLNKILEYSSFDYMKKTLAKGFDNPSKKLQFVVGGHDGSVGQDMSKGIDNSCSKREDRQNHINTGNAKISHFRKGVVGDWRTHFSEEQSERMNRKFYQRFAGTEIFEKYKPFL